MGEPDWSSCEKILIQMVTLKGYRIWNGFALQFTWTSFRSVQLELLDWQKGHKIGLRIQSPIQRVDYGKL